MESQAARVLEFWFKELDKADWFKKNDTVDARITAEFGNLYEALAGHIDPAWRSAPKHCLAAIIVLDQFPRNMFRNSPRAFATDKAALALSKSAIDQGFAGKLTLDEKQFLYMPFQHSEDAADQARSIELFADFSQNTLDFARRHKEIIDQFGRFPHRNAVLGRESTAAELAFLEQPNSSF